MTRFQPRGSADVGAGEISFVTVFIVSYVTVVITDVIVIANVIPLGLPGKRGRSQGVLGILSVTF